MTAGKNVVVEKPFTATLEEGQELAVLAKQTGSYMMDDVFRIITSSLPFSILQV